MGAEGPRIGSLCSGYGGLDLGVQAVLGGTVVWHCDPDPGASAILSHHWSDVPNLGDLTVADWSQVAPVDVVLGGYPCQPFSMAGQRKGTNDDRHIWPYIARALGVLRPRLAIFENVAGHVSLGLDTVLADLARLGFDAEWTCVRASEVDAPHQRKRLFILAHAADAPSAGRQGARPESARGGPERGGAPSAADAPLVGSPWSGSARRGWPRSADRGFAAADSDRRGLTEYGELPAGRDAVRRGQRHDADGRDPAPAADAARVRRREGRPESEVRQRQLDPVEHGIPDWGAYEPAIRRWEQRTRPAPRPTDHRGRLGPRFVEWLMGLDDGHVTDVPGLSRTAQLRALGNGVVPLQAAYALRELLHRAGLVEQLGLAA